MKNKSKSLSQPVIDLLSHMSKLVDKGLTPTEAVEWMQELAPLLDVVKLLTEVR